jgi:glyoxylase-like metal-dependent hydrolase (beta-lactamase superfamily II)
MRRCETHFLQLGCCRHPEAATLRGGRLGQTVFPALAGLFLHPDEGPILFDTGYDQAFVDATAPFPQRLYRWATPPEFAPNAARDQLARFGLTTRDIRWVVLSHFHGDHVAGLHLYPQAKIACSRLGLEAARHGPAWSAVARGILRRLIPADIDERLVCFEDRPRVNLPSAFRPFESGADIFGDGSLLAVELPGHCPGHWGMAARGADDAMHLLAADAAWSSQAIREDRPPPRLTTALLGRTAPYRETLHRLHLMANANPDVIVTPAHCEARAAQIRTESR